MKLNKVVLSRFMISISVSIAIFLGVISCENKNTPKVPAEYSIFEFNESGKISKKIFYSNGLKDWEVKYIYDSNNFLIREETLYENTTERWEYQYDSLGNLIRTQRYDDNILVYENEYSSNRKKKLIRWYNSTFIYDMGQFTNKTFCFRGEVSSINPKYNRYNLTDESGNKISIFGSVDDIASVGDIIVVIGTLKKSKKSPLYYMNINSVNQVLQRISSKENLNE